MSDAWTAARIQHLLLDRHAPPQWAFFRELADATGYDQRRTFDAWAMNVWPSSGFATVGYEIKVSRGDLARELRDPTKRAPIERVSSECFFAVPAGLMRPDEVPEGWGLIEATDGDEPKLRVRKHAMQRKIDALPPMFIASLARRCADPPEPMPVLAWKLAGRMLRLSDLDHLLDARAKRRKIPTIAADRRLEDDTAARKDLRAIQEVLAGAFGYRAAYHLDELRRVLTNRPAPGQVSAEMRQKLVSIQRELGEILSGP